MNFANITLGELLSSQNEIIKRNAFSILKQLQKERDKQTQKCKCTDTYKNPSTIWCDVCHKINQ